MILVLGLDYFDSGLGFRNLTQTHLLKPSELTHKLPRDVVEASIPVLTVAVGCGITNKWEYLCGPNADGNRTVGLRFVRFGLLA